MKTFLRVDTSADDALIAILIRAARVYAENYLGRQLVTASWRVAYDGFPAGDDDTIYLPKPPAVSVGSVVYTDTNGSTQTLAAGRYTLDATREPGRLVPAYGEIWPATRAVPGAVLVNYTAGYGGAAAVPEIVRTAIRMYVGFYYEHREPVEAEWACVNRALDLESYGEYR